MNTELNPEFSLAKLLNTEPNDEFGLAGFSQFEMCPAQNHELCQVDELLTMVVIRDENEEKPRVMCKANDHC